MVMRTFVNLKMLLDKKDIIVNPQLFLYMYIVYV